MARQRDQRPEPLDVALEPLVETTSSDLSRPRHVVVIFKDGQVYLIMAAAAGGADVSSAFDEVLRTWRWNEVE